MYYVLLNCVTNEHLIKLDQIFWIKATKQNFELSESALNTPGTAGGPGGRDRTLAVKS